jgi:gamma-glutamyltranspeptidase/glutathione hydrolase
MIRRVVFPLILGLAVSSLARGQDGRPGGTRPPDGPLARQWEASGSKGAVVAGGSEAVAAGIAILDDGGNAVDAACATILALTVTDANAFCFGGEVPILIHDAKRGTTEVIAGQGAAPRLATREHFAARGPTIPLKGIEAAAVPATLDAILTALDRSGTRTFAAIAAPTLAILDRHERPWHADLAATIRELVGAEKASSDRRRGLSLAADCFYRGPIARRIDAWSKASGGLLRYTDLATHVTRVEEPVRASYRGHTVLKCGPWTQGPCLLQALQLLEGIDLAAVKHAPDRLIHLEAEALKLALADRDEYYADPLYADVPLAELLAPSYVELRRPLIDPDHASRVHRPGDPIRGRALLDRSTIHTAAGALGNDTTTCIVADSEGNVVAATPSGWSGVLAGDTGVWLGSRLQSFNLWPDHRNVIEPGKRPRITLTPTLVLDAQGQPVIAVSVAGGDLQDQTSLQMLVDLIDLGMSPAEAVRAPRFSTEHHLGSFGQTPPRLGSLAVNPEVGGETIEALKQRGHDVTTSRGAIAAPVVLRLDRATRRIHVAGDPRAGRHAAALE